MALQLHKIEINANIAFAVKDDESLPKKIRSAMQDDYQALGLKRFLLIQDKRYQLSCNNVEKAL